MFKDLKLGVRIMGGFSLILLVTIIIGIIGYRGLSLVVERVDKADDANRLVKYVLDLRTEEKNYLMRGNPDESVELHQIIEKIQAQITESKAQFQSAENDALMDQLSDVMTTYLDLFDQYVAIDIKGKANQATMEVAARELEKNLIVFREQQKQQIHQLLTTDSTSAEIVEELNEADAANRMVKGLLEIRRDEKNYLLRIGKAADQAAIEVKDGVSRLREQAEEMAASVERQSSKDLAATVLQKLNDYSAAYDRFLTGRTQQRELLPKLEHQAREFEAQAIIIRSDQKQELTSDVSHTNTMSIISNLIALLLGGTLALLMTRSLTKPISQAVQLAREIAKGDFSMRLKLDRNDEVGMLANALDEMALSLAKNAEVAEKIAAGDLSVEVTLASEKDQFGIAFRHMVRTLNDVLGQIQSAGEQLAAGSGQVSDASQSLSQGATEQASSLEEISSSLQQMAAQTTSNAENARQANDLANASQDSAQTGSQRMQAMVKSMEEIDSASQQISRIISTIDEIAFQTNLLALNAAVEAARAGQHGKGFAVVAEEVRNLASRSAKAAEETAELIEGSVVKTTRGRQIAHQMEEALQELVDGIGKVSVLVDEIATASREQAEGVSQISVGVNQIDQVTQVNTANAEQSAAAAEELSGQATQLHSLMQQFKLEKG